ncbi:hypothetical protein RCO28_20575 [Streptomyces sp. LHD-70]|uniref:hypothetical protein n=1 Tax=Streptomyces sp. LHD-70 TaxID=3072140 RepID=UPI00280C74E2|nr:hypothetical protein [Streptomyces sp. LHD-70]MDQ8704868.1 hypothetical protein [Streptomyces sp. LHD-70]
MTLHMLGKDPNSPDGKSATIYYDDVKDRYLVQGLKVLDEERLSQMDLPNYETVVEIPKYMAQFFPEVNGDSAEPEVH